MLGSLYINDEFRKQNVSFNFIVCFDVINGIGNR